MTLSSAPDRDRDRDRDHGRNRDRHQPEPWELASGSAVLLLFGLKLWHEWRAGTPANLLWLCYLGNLLMGTGLLARRSVLVRIGMLWVLAGLPLWLVDVLATRQTNLLSVLSHLGGSTVALLAWSCRCWTPRPADWLVAWLGALLVQAGARLFTPPALNVNLAHAIHASSTAWFNSYPVYAAAVAAGMAAALWALQELLQAAKRRFLPPVPAPGVSR